MDNFNKIYEKAENKLKEDDKRYQFYALNSEKRVFSIGRSGQNPHTLIIYWQVGDDVTFQGVLNNTKFSISDGYLNNNNAIRIISNLSNNKEPEIIINSIYYGCKYSKKSFDNKMSHKLVVFQENRKTTDILMYDSQINKIPTYIKAASVVDQSNIKNIAVSLLASYDNNFYKILSGNVG